MLLLSDFHQFLGNLRQFLHFRFDSGFIFAFQGSFQRAQGRLDSGFVISRQFIACFFNLLTGAVQQMVAPGYGSEPALRTYGQIQRSLLHREPFSEFLPRSDQKTP